MPTITAPWMLYGAYGYTGQLIAEEAARRGHTPLLAGRDAAKLRPLAERLNLDWVAVPLDDPAALREAVQGVHAVLHAAGPFVHTAPPMIAACLDGVSSYLDITGEIPVFEHAFRHDQDAYEREIALIPGVGFDVVPSDCLLAYVAEQVADVQALTLVVDAINGVSGGTARSMIHAMRNGGLARRDGALARQRLGRGARRFRLPDGDKAALPIPWGDLATAYRSTGAPNITTYMTFPPAVMRLVALSAPLMGVIGIPAVNRALQSLAGRLFRGPDAAERESGRSALWAKAEAADGAYAEAWLQTGEAYHLTVRTALRAVERLLDERPKGALTPAQAFGPDFILEIPNTRRLDALP